MFTPTDAAHAVVDAGSVGAAAASLRDGEIEQAACGIADLASTAPLTTAHRFRIGSIKHGATAV